MAIRRWLTTWIEQSRVYESFGPLGTTVQQKALLEKLRYRLQQDPACRLETLTEVSMAAALGVQIDVNRAGVEDWLRLPGVSIHQARLLHGLAQSGVQFHGLEDLAAALGVSENQLQGFLPILQFCYYDPELFLQPKLVDPNTASLEQLRAIPGLTPSCALAIVQARHRGAPFRDLADFQRRLQLPTAMLEELMHYLRF